MDLDDFILLYLLLDKSNGESKTSRSRSRFRPMSKFSNFLYYLFLIILIGFFIYIMYKNSN